MTIGKPTMTPEQEAEWLAEMQARAEGGIYSPSTTRKVSQVARQKSPKTLAKEKLVAQEIEHLRAIRMERWGV